MQERQNVVMFFNLLNFYSQKVYKKFLFLIINLMYLFLDTLLDENKHMI